MYSNNYNSDMGERSIERSPMRYNSNACKNCGYKNRPSMSADVCSTCIYRNSIKKNWNKK